MVGSEPGAARSAGSVRLTAMKRTRTVGAAQLAAVLLTVPMVSGCALLYWDKCIYELRSVSARGEIPQSGADPIVARVQESEQRDSDPSKSMYWVVTGPATLKSHVTSAVLRDAADNSVRFIFPLSPPERATIAEDATGSKAGANLNGLFDVLSHGRGVVELGTDIPSQPVISIPLAVESKYDWNRPSCG